jgi:hypothetical protein
VMKVNKLKNEDRMGEEATANQAEMQSSNQVINNGDGFKNRNGLDSIRQKNHVESWLKSQLGVQGSCATFLEAHLADKCQSRSEAEKKFRWDIFHFIVYSLFLILYSFSACGTDMRGKLLARNLLEGEIGKFDDVQHIGKSLSVQAVIAMVDFRITSFAADVYGFLETVIIPIVTEGGTHPSEEISPIAAASAWLTLALHSGTFTTSGNVMMTPVLTCSRAEGSCTNRPHGRGAAARRRILNRHARDAASHPHTKIPSLQSSTPRARAWCANPTQRAAAAPWPGWSERPPQRPSRRKHARPAPHPLSPLRTPRPPPACRRRRAWPRMCALNHVHRGGFDTPTPFAPPRQSAPHGQGFALSTKNAQHSKWWRQQRVFDPPPLKGKRISTLQH